MGARAMSACDGAFAHGDVASAIDEARAAAEARALASPYPARGYERLIALAHTTEQNGDWSNCARAWRAVRSAALATRMPLVDLGGAAAHLQEANVQLARIGARTRGSEGMETSETAASLEAKLREDLTRDERPSAYAYVALGAGGLLFYLGIASLLMRGTTRWPATWRAALVVAGALLAALGCWLPS